MMGPRPGMGGMPGGPMSMGARPGMMHPSAFPTSGGPPSSMMGSSESDLSQEPEKMRKLKVELTDKERGYYANMMSKVESENSSRIDGK